MGIVSGHRGTLLLPYYLLNNAVSVKTTWNPKLCLMSQKCGLLNTSPITAQGNWNFIWAGGEPPPYCQTTSSSNLVGKSGKTKYQPSGQEARI